jgi:hypothetical protein
MSLSNGKILRAWKNGKSAKNGRRSLTTDGEKLYSYNLVIGVNVGGKLYVGDYTSRDQNFVSMTTSRHVNIARCFADEFQHVSAFKLISK